MEKKHILVLNPAAGQGKAIDLKEAILKAKEKTALDIEIYETKEVLDAEVFTSAVLKNIDDTKKVRIYACGGDGTVNEILNAILHTGKMDNIELGIVPVGTGNDFVRNFGDLEDFLDIEKQLSFETQQTDVIKYQFRKNDFTYTRYGINMFNIGFDCNVVDITARLKRLPLVSGSMAYIMGVAAMLVRKKGANLKVEFEDGEIFDGKMLLIAIANGCFCGGGVKGVPYASTNDGLMDISLIKKCGRIEFLKLFPQYAKGTHLENKKAHDLIIYKKSKKLKIIANETAMLFSADGEITEADEISFEIVPKAISVALPTEGGSEK